MKKMISKLNTITLFYSFYGFIYGSFIYLFTNKFKNIDKDGYISVALSVFFMTTVLLVSIYKKNKIKFDNLPFSVLASLSLSVFYYFLIKHNKENYPSYHYSSVFDTYLFLALFFLYIIFVLYLKSFLISKETKKVFNYDNLTNILSDYISKIFISLILLAGIWIILALWSALFDFIGITFFNELLFKYDYPPMVLTSGIFFGAYGTVNDIEINFFRGALKFKYFNVFLEIISLFLIVFILFLPITGLKKVFNSENPSLIMISLNAIGIFLIQFVDLNDKENISKTGRSLIKTFIFLEPVLALLAFYSLSLRIGQYGYTPSRFIALEITLFFLLFDFIYFYSALRYGNELKKYVKILTPYLILILAAVVVFTLTPILNPYEISVKSQLSLYKSKPEKIDYPELKFKFSKPGRNALNILLEQYKDNKKVVELINKTKKCKHYYDCIEKNTLYQYPKLNMHPENISKPDFLDKLLKKNYKYEGYYDNSDIVIKDFLDEYDGNEIIFIKKVFVLGKIYIYKGLFVNKNGKYKLIKEKFDGYNGNIDYENVFKDFKNED